MTHPLASEALMVDAFGDVHMLSHLLGASNRADIRRLNALEKEREALSEELAGTRRQLAAKDADVRRLAVALEDESRAARSGREAASPDAQSQVRALTEEGAYRELQARIAVLESRLEEADRGPLAPNPGGGSRSSARRRSCGRRATA